MVNTERAGDRQPVLRKAACERLGTCVLALVLALAAQACVWPADFDPTVVGDATNGDADDTTAPGACSPGEMLCGGACRSVLDNVDHCGLCGHQCMDGETCFNGQCLCEAASGAQARACDFFAGETCCPQSGCVDLQTAAGHCGTCGQACGPRETCQQGTCTCGDAICAGGAACCADGCCAAGQACCNGQCVPDGTPCVCTNGETCGNGMECCADGCVDVGTSLTHCGQCGMACGPHQICASGECVCGAGWDDCDGEPTNGCEADLGTVTDCGSCRNLCDPGEVCASGVCQCGSTQAVCLSTERCCDGQCFDVVANRAHCGSCGNDCGALPSVSGTSCAAGSCQIDACQQLTADCDGVVANGCEVDTGDDAANCGGCDALCPASSGCLSGACTCGSSCSCPAGKTLCGDSCVDLTKDRNHCGSCTKICPGTKTCVGGTCVCPDGKNACNNICVDLSNDESNCGACGNVCPAYISVCCGGTCRAVTQQESFCGGCDHREQCCLQQDCTTTCTYSCGAGNYGN